MDTHSLSIEQQLDRGELLSLVRTYSRFLKLCKSGFPFSDARHMAGLQDDMEFDKAHAVYRSFL